MDKKIEHQTIELTEAEKRFEGFVKNLPNILKWLAGILLVVYLLSALFRGDVGIGENEDLGAFGDFIGGVLNPSLTFLTVYLLVFSIRFQLDELKQTRQELVQSREAQQSTSNSLAETHKLNKFQIEYKLLLDQLASMEKIYGLFTFGRPRACKLNPIAMGAIPPTQSAGNDLETVDLETLAMIDKSQHKSFHLTLELDVPLLLDELSEQLKLVEEMSKELEPTMPVHFGKYAEQKVKRMGLYLTTISEWSKARNRVF